MTSDAASPEPRKRSWKRLFVVWACVVAVITIALLALTPKQEPVKVWFVRATNELGEKKLVFQVTNGIGREIVFAASVTTEAMQDSKALANWRAFPKAISIVAAAGTNFSFSLPAPPKDLPYRVMWRYYDFKAPVTRWARFRFGCFSFFRDHGMPRLAERLKSSPELHYIPSTEIKE